MKISIGMNVQAGSFGGGNQFAGTLADYLATQGDSVSFDLASDRLDLILLTEPRLTSTSSMYTDYDVIRYIRKHPHAVVVHRINECDERKGTNYVNSTLRRANLSADHTIFVSEWLRTLHASHGLRPRSSEVIYNGANANVFHPNGQAAWLPDEPLRIVTHHWSGNWMKGFDIYQQLDELLAGPDMARRFQFTYIGNVPDGFRFHNSRYVKPLSGHELANELRQHHVYITASQNEPGGNHQNEGASCGLPLLYRPSGSMAEYCQGYGIAFDNETLKDKMVEMRENYAHWRETIRAFPHTAERMCQTYRNTFESLLDGRSDLEERRQERGSLAIPWWAYLPKRLQKSGPWLMSRLTR